MHTCSHDNFDPIEKFKTNLNAMKNIRNLLPITRLINMTLHFEGLGLGKKTRQKNIKGGHKIYTLKLDYTVYFILLHKKYIQL